MRRSLLCAICALFVWGTGAEARAEEGSLSDPDKDQHIRLSAAVSSVSYITLRGAGYEKITAAAGAFGITLALGLAKELTDPQFSREDLKADALGALTPLVVIEIISLSF